LTQKQDSESYNIQNVCDIKQNYSAYEKFGKFQLAQEMTTYTCDNMLVAYEITLTPRWQMSELSHWLKSS